MLGKGAVRRYHDAQCVADMYWWFSCITLITLLILTPFFFRSVRGKGKPKKQKTAFLHLNEISFPRRPCFWDPIGLITIILAFRRADGARGLAIAIAQHVNYVGDLSGDMDTCAFMELLHPLNQ